ncbi:MAG: hypothetical protein GC157_12000 [Frankiales bacterium]|nr:hypothetical protein [Frankiales bacterium]
MLFLLTVLVPFADSPSPSPSPTVTPPPDDMVSPGLLGFLALLFLVVAGYFIARGLNKQLKRVDFDEEAVNAPDDGVDGSEGPTAQG